MRLPVALAVITLAPLAALGAPAEKATPKPVDRMLAVDASPLKRIRLTGVIGRVVNITFSPREAIYRVVFGTAGIWEGPQAGANGQAVALKNNLPLWPVQVGHTNLVVTTVDAEGHEYPYQFDLTSLPAQPEPTEGTATLAAAGTAAPHPEAGEEADAVDGLIVRNTEAERAEAAAKARAVAEARAVVAQQRQAVVRETQARSALATTTEAGEPGPGCNPRYVGWGSTAIAPVSVCDNGQMTFLRYQGQLRPPSVFILGPDGKEQALIPFMRGDTLVVPRVAKEMHLYSGQTVLYIFNRAYDPAGVNPATGGLADPGTGTVSPAVRRVLRSNRNAR